MTGEAKHDELPDVSSVIGILAPDLDIAQALEQANADGGPGGPLPQ
jgi:hypothetical protein